MSSVANYWIVAAWFKPNTSGSNLTIFSKYSPRMDFGVEGWTGQPYVGREDTFSAEKFQV